VGTFLYVGPGRHVEHDDGALAVDVVPVAKAAELFLPGGVPAVEADGTAVGVELEGVDRHADGGCLERETRGMMGERVSQSPRQCMSIAVELKKLERPRGSI
jgi:hypothetical protein